MAELTQKEVNGSPKAFISTEFSSNKKLWVVACVAALLLGVIVFLALRWSFSKPSAPPSHHQTSSPSPGAKKLKPLTQSQVDARLAQKLDNGVIESINGDTIVVKASNGSTLSLKTNNKTSYASGPKGYPTNFSNIKVGQPAMFNYDSKLMTLNFLGVDYK